MDGLPALPDGFVLDQQASLPPLPPGFVHDQQPTAGGKTFGQAVQSLWENPPPGPSMIGLAKNIFSGLTLPGDVYQGNVDPRSDEAIKRAGALAGTVALGSTAAPAGALGTGLVRPAAKTATPTIQALEEAASPTFQAAVQKGVATELPEGVGANISQSLKTSLDVEGFRSANAKRTLNAVNSLSGAKDVQDVLLARQKLRDVAAGISENKLVTIGGADRAAAGKAKDAIDNLMGEDFNRAMRTADANWAAAQRAKMVQEAEESGSLGTLAKNNKGNLQRRGFAPDEISAIKRAKAGGIPGQVLSAAGAALNPFHGGLSAAVQGGAAVLTGGHSLLGAPFGIAADVGAKALRNAAFNRAINRILQRSPLAKETLNGLSLQPGGGIFGLLNRNPQGLLPFLSSPLPTTQYQ